MEEKYYCVLMKKNQIYENVAIYIPERIISGFVSDAISEDDISKVFVEEGYENEYLFMDDVQSIFQPNEEVVGLPITEKELMEQAEGLDIEQAKIEYFDRISETTKIGFYIPEQFEEKLIFLDLALEELKYELSEADKDEEGNISISYYDVISSLINFESFNDLVKLKESELDRDDTTISLKKISIGNSQDKSNDQIIEKVLKEYYNIGIEEQEETFEHLVNKLKLLSPKDLIRCNDIERMREKTKVVKSICTKMTQIIENSKVDEKTKKSILKTVDSIGNYYDDKIGNISDLETIKFVLQSCEFIYDNNLEVLEDYNKLLNLYEKKDISRETKMNTQKNNRPFSVKEVKEKCDKVIIGQEAAKEAVISTVYMNQKEGNHLTKNTLLLVGPTGSGKTLIAETVAGILDIPSISIDTTQLTIAGYKGADIENYLATLINRAGGDKNKAERGIVIFDEFDKKGSENNDDVSGKGVLNSLLPFIQGTLYKVNMGKGCSEKVVDFNTNNLTILVAGSCTDAIKAKEKEQNKVLGFATKTDKKEEKLEYCKITKEDVEKYCNIPEEFMGRITNMVQLQPHTKDTIRQILLESDISPLLSEKEKLYQDDIELSWNDEYIENLSERVLQDSHGVRALKEFIEISIMSARWKVLHEEDVFNEIILNGQSIENPDETVLVYKDGNYTTVKELKEKETLEKQKVKEKSNDKK